jgi:small-conductance mechanosensitive channel
VIQQENRDGGRYFFDGYLEEQGEGSDGLKAGMMKRMSNYQRRRLIQGSRAVVAIVILSVFVFIMYVLGLPSIVAIAAGGGFAGIVSTTIERRRLPKPPPWSDEERVQLPRLRPR